MCAGQICRPPPKDAESRSTKPYKQQAVGSVIHSGQRQRQRHTEIAEFRRSTKSVSLTAAAAAVVVVVVATMLSCSGRPAVIGVITLLQLGAFRMIVNVG